MDIKNYLILLIILVQPLFGWGEEAHFLVTRKAMEMLPPEMQTYKPWFVFVQQHCIDADTRKDSIKTEGVRHYINLDYYQEFRAGNMAWNRDTLNARYGADQVNKVGILPWAVMETYNNLVEAFQTGQTARVKQMMADLAHYAADAHQPMHTMLNYNGQLSNQIGVHARYEIEMINQHIQTLEDDIKAKTVKKRKNIFSFVTDFLTDSHIEYPILFNADLIAAKETGSVYNSDYLAILWFYTEKVSSQQLNRAAHHLAVLYYSAWVEAGSPAFDTFNDK